MGYAQTAAVTSVLLIGSTMYTELSGRSGRLSFDRKVCLFVDCFLAIQCQGERGKTAIWRYGGEGGALWRLSKTAIWLQKCGFTRVLGTLANWAFVGLVTGARHMTVSYTHLRAHET